MKACLSLLLAVLFCLSLLGCSEKKPAYTPLDYSDSEEPTQIVITTPASDGTLQSAEDLSMTTDKGSIVYAGVEYANKSLADSESAAVFKFTFTNHQENSALPQSAFLIKYYQNGVEVREQSWYNSLGGDQFELCCNYSLEVAKGDTVTYGRPVLLNDNSPVTVIIYELGYHENYRAMEIDLSGLPIVPVDTTLPTPAQIPNCAVSLESKKGSVRFVGFEKAHYGLMEDDHALVFQFEYTSRQPLPATYQSAFLIKYYQNGVEVKEGLRITSNGEEHYTLCYNRSLEVMEGGTLIFGQPVSLKDDSPVTITIQSLENWDNILSLEIIPVF